jgi:hypothetical protein
MKQMKIVLFLLTSSCLSFANAAEDAMPSMPKISPKRVYIVKGDEDLESQKGFGEEAPMVRMMNLMMVEGSGMEGMNMASGSSPSVETFPYMITLSFNAEDAKVGTNLLKFSIMDAKTMKPMKGLQINSKVYMTSMDMGTEEPKIKEVKPGEYQVKASFSMQGSWAVKLIFPENKEKVFDFNVKNNHR